MTHIYQILMRLFAIFGVAVFCFIVWFVAVAMWRVPIHQFNLWKLGKNFQAITTANPPDSKPLLQIRRVGNFFRGASNACDYLVGEFYVEKRSKHEILERYRGLFVNSFDDTEPVPMEVHFLDEEEFFQDSYWSDWRKKIKKSFNLAVMQGNPYIIFASQTDYPPYGDIRCFYGAL